MTVTQQIVNVDGENIALLHDTQPRRTVTLQNILVDEQYVAVSLGQDTDIDAVYGNTSPLFGSDTTYQEALIFFAPNDKAAQVKSLFHSAVSELIEGKREFGDLEEAQCGIAFRKTPSGLWVFVTTDANDDTFLDEMGEVCDGLNPVPAYDWNSKEQQPCDNMTLYATATESECGGEDFVNGLARMGNSIFQLMQSEGLIDAEVEFVHWNESD